MPKENELSVNCLEIEVAVSLMFGIRQNIIVPNISWGANLHECDLIVVNKSGYATEVEIKVSKSDLKKDFTKGYGHKSEMIKHLYYALPKDLVEFGESIIPKSAGIIVCEKIKRHSFVGNEINPETGEVVEIHDYNKKPYVSARFHRQPASNHYFRKLTDKEIVNISRLGCMRIWGLKIKLIKEQHERRVYLSNQKGK